jgi:hypothetical protein
MIHGLSLTSTGGDNDVRMTNPKDHTILDTSFDARVAEIQRFDGDEDHQGRNAQHCQS